jgi:hypothetical protein
LPKTKRLAEKWGPEHARFDIFARIFLPFPSGVDEGGLNVACRHPSLNAVFLNKV